MKTERAPKSTTPKTDADELELVPARAAQLIHGIVATPAVRATLALAGMTTADITEGRTRLAACLRETETASFDKAAIEKRRAALAELNAWDEPGFARFGAALQQHAPSAHEYVFTGVAASGDAEEAVRAIATFLARVDALEAGGTVAADKSVVTLLETRGLTRDVRKRLLELVAAALAPAGDVKPSHPVDATRVERLRSLRAWCEEWSNTARALVKGRRELARLGITARKSPKKTAPRRNEPVADTERAPAPPLRVYPSQLQAP